MTRSNFSQLPRPWANHLALFAFYVLLSFLLEGASIYFGYKRYFFSAEMFLVLLFVSSGWIRLGAVLFTLSCALEISLAMASMFYLFEKEQLWDMLEFIFEARLNYLLGIASVPAFGAAIFCMFRIFGERIKSTRRAILLQTLIALAAVQGQWALSAEKQNFFSPTFSERSQLVFGSTAYFIHELMTMNRLSIIGDRSDEQAEYLPIQHPSAIQSIWNGKLPDARRILLIVAEGWGITKDQGIFEQQISSLLHSPHVNMIQTGKVYAKGATAAGELRELCGVVPTRLNFRKMTREKVGTCLPEELRLHGYMTTGIHGAYGGMYRRTLWWPQIGLTERIFREDITSTKEICHSFPGHCDRNLVEIIKDKLSKDKSFVYWLSLNSHMPYDRKDVVNYRESLCTLWPINDHWNQLCDYQNLHVQFFEGISLLADDPRMKNVEVIVVGDHPPLFNDEENKERFVKDKVPFLHFFIK